MTTTGRRGVAGGPPPPDAMSTASISGQSMPSGLARHQGWSGTRRRVSRLNWSSAAIRA
jgi:hypothetical protein